jgi:TatD DNase family protein
MELIDTHCHLNFASYDDDREAVIERARAAGVTRIIIPATDLTTGQEAIDLAQRYPAVFASAGIHPNSTADFSGSYLSRIEAQARLPRVVAVGEIGLDYHWDKSPRDIQQRAFEAQLELAARLEMPVIIHNREASEDVMTTLERWAADLPPSLHGRAGVLHSFSASPAIAERALAAGFYIGFTGPVTFKNADELRSVAAMVPLERMLVETDGPFLTPAPHRGQRNEPAYVPFIAERLAAVRNIGVDELARATTANAVCLFQLPSAG